MRYFGQSSVGTAWKQTPDLTDDSDPSRVGIGRRTGSQVSDSVGCTSAVGESRHRIAGASVGQPTEPCFRILRLTLCLCRRHKQRPAFAFARPFTARPMRSSRNPPLQLIECSGRRRPRDLRAGCGVAVLQFERFKSRFSHSRSNSRGSHRRAPSLEKIIELVKVGSRRQLHAVLIATSLLTCTSQRSRGM